VQRLRDPNKAWQEPVAPRPTRLAFTSIFLILLALSGHGQATDVLTFHNDNARTGQALNEQILTPGNVNTNHFGKLWVLNTDGKVDAQPLYVASVSIPGVGWRNVLFVATENDSLYAFNADGTNLFWETRLVGAGETSAVVSKCNQVSPEIGITGTPVIDRQLGPNGALFAVAMSQQGSNYFQRLYALDLATGTNLVSPATISASFPGAGPYSTNGILSFNPGQYKERCGLLLSGGVVYTAWASHCDMLPYTSWIIGYDEHTLAQTNVLNLTPNGIQGGIWMANGGLAADSAGNIFLLDGNGTFDTNLNQAGFPVSNNFGNAFVKLSTASNTLTPVDYFATFTNSYEIANDVDLGSGGVVLLPDMLDAQGNTRQLAVGAGKDANIYVVDRSNLGKFNPTNNSAIYQAVPGALHGMVFSTPAYYNGTLYYAASGDHLQAFAFRNALLTNVSSQSLGSYASPGATPGVSANGSSNGIVWALESASVAGPAGLYAYAATNVTQPIYNNTVIGTIDRFVTPTIASGRVYVGTTTGVVVFGLLDQSTLTPVQVWRNAYFGNPSNVGAGANAASPANDGVPNLVKYALGLNPFTSANSAQLPSGSLEPSGDQTYLTLTINLYRTNQAPDVTYLVGVSPDLQTWLSGPPNTVTLNNTPTQIVVRDTTPVAGSTGRFIRLRITTPSPP